MSKSLYGLVLAGGKSRRLGQDKALLRRDGKNQLERLTGLLEDCCERVFVSARADQGDDPTRAKFAQVVDRYEGMGPMAGILSAQESYPDVDWLVVACDLPNISAATLSYLIEHRSTTQPFTAFISSHDGFPEPLCAIYRSGSNQVLRTFVDDGKVCPRKVLINSDTHLLEQAQPDWLDNVNTPEDLDDSALEASA